MTTNIELLAEDSISQPLTDQGMARVLAAAIGQHVVGSEDDVAVYYDLGRLDQRLAALRGAFGANAVHAIAVKANPLVAILKRIQLAGMAAEVASIGEVSLALAAGFSADNIIFDSPVKTVAELTFALAKGIGINANSLAELALIAALYPRSSSQSQSQSRVGIRINPETGMGKIDTTSVATAHSKFGVSLTKHRAELAQAFGEYSWLTAIHVHIGSQGMLFEQLLAGISRVYDFFIETRQAGQINTFNIGGGLPALYQASDIVHPFADYAKALKQRCPALFTEDITLITEFGRSIHASCGWVASKIEYVVENDPQTSTLFNHVGADMLLRTAYRPNDWFHRLSVCDGTGQLKSGVNSEVNSEVNSGVKSGLTTAELAPAPTKTYQVAGPLCFAGDYISRGAVLPADIHSGDILLIHDAGAYTFSMWSLYNSRQFPTVIGYETIKQDDKAGQSTPQGAAFNFSVLRRRQTVAEIVAFWS